MSNLTEAELKTFLNIQAGCLIIVALMLSVTNNFYLYGSNINSIVHTGVLSVLGITIGLHVFLSKKSTKHLIKLAILYGASSLGLFALLVITHYPF